MIAQNFTISACLIVRNEEKQLSGCLDTLKNIVDEIVIVDTGSTDTTIEIAKSFGAKVYEHQWENDFSKHRNQAIQYASGKWLLNIDADERLVLRKNITRDMLIDLLRKLPNSCNAIMLPMRDINPQGDVVTEYMNVRLVKNTTDFHYEGLVHENPVFEGKPIAISEIALNHHGYHLAQQEMDRKYKRNTDLLLKRLEENPEDIATYFYLTNHYAFVLPNTPETLQKAIEFSRKCIQLLQQHPPETWSSAYLGIFRTIGELFFLVGDNQEAATWCLEGLKIIPDDPDLHFLLCKISIATSKYELTAEHGNLYLNALKKYRQKPQLARGRVLVSVSRDSELAAHYRVMTAYLGMKNWEKAEEQWHIIKEYVLLTYQRQMEYLRNLSLAGDSDHLFERTLLFYALSSPNENSLLNSLIDFSVKAGVLETTVEALLTKLSENDSLVEPVYYIADYLMKKGNHKEVVALLAPLNSSSTIDTNTIPLLALAYEKIGENEHAREIYDFHLNDGDIGREFIINAMNFYKNIADQNALQTAVAILIKRNTYRDLNDDVLLFLVNFYWLSEKYDDFLTATKAIIHRHIQHDKNKFQDTTQMAEGYAALSSCFINQEKHNLAFQALHIAWSISGNPRYIYLLGNLFFDTDQTEMGLQYYQEALNRDYITSEILDKMQIAHQKLGNASGSAICQKLKEKLLS